MEPHQQRVVVEKGELDDRREKLTAFLSTEMFNQLPELQKALLRAQGTLMGAYSDILARRIETF